MRGMILLLGLLFWGCDTPHDPSLPYPMTLTSEGLGTLRAGERFEASLIQGRFPGLGVEKLSQIVPQGAQTLFILKRHETALGYVFPDKSGKAVAKITVISPLIPDETGRKTGEVLPALPNIRCSGEECTLEHSPLRYRIDPASRIIREITLQKL